MQKKSIVNINVNNKTVLLRVDFNIPLQIGISSEPIYDHRIRSALPTIYYLLGSNAKIILCSHLGRPNGTNIENLKLEPVAKQLEKLLLMPIKYVNDCVGPTVEKAINNLKPKEILLLENLRFHKGEEANNQEFAINLSKLADVFIMDAFGVAHRKHASTVAIHKLLPSAAGFLLEREIILLEDQLKNPTPPFGAILGGSKIDDKIKVIRSLLPKIDKLFIGGEMAKEFIKYTTNNHVPKTTIETEIASIIELTKKLNVELILPEDVVVTEKFGEESKHSLNVEVNNMPNGWSIMDIGQKTIEKFKEELKKCKTIIWNGPMGVFEIEAFKEGTKNIAQLLSTNNGTTIVGGGSTAEAVEKLGYVDRMTHVSTGGGACLQLLQGNELPGISALPNK